MDLTAAIPTVRRWTQPDIPKKLTPEEVKQVLETPDPLRLVMHDALMVDRHLRGQQVVAAAQATRTKHAFSGDQTALPVHHPPNARDRQGRDGQDGPQRGFLHRV